MGVRNGRSQREAYDKIDKKQKERADLIDAARNAFIFTYIGREMRADRVLDKCRMEPNPAFKATSHADIDICESARIPMVR